MAYNNTVILTGNLGSPASEHEKDDRLFTAFSLATKDSYQNKEGEWQQKQTVWHRVLAFNPTVVELSKSFKKGARLEVTGSLSYRPFELGGKGKKKITKYEASIIAHKIEARPLVKRQAGAEAKPE